MSKQNASAISWIGTFAIGSTFDYIVLKNRGLMGYDMRPEVYCGRTRWLVHSPGPPRRSHEVLRLSTQPIWPMNIHCCTIIPMPAHPTHSERERSIKTIYNERFCHLMKYACVWIVKALYIFIPDDILEEDIRIQWSMDASFRCVLGLNSMFEIIWNSCFIKRVVRNLLWSLLDLIYLVLLKLKVKWFKMLKMKENSFKYLIFKMDFGKYWKFF